MKLSEIYTICNEISPFELAESWDNSGLQVGDKNQEITNIHVSLDIDEELLDTLSPNTLLITHHPLIFSPLKSLEYGAYPAMFLQKCIKKDIAVIAMHTNFDKTHLNAYVAQEVLGFEITHKEDFVLYFDFDGDFAMLQKQLREKLNLQSIKSVQTQKKIKKVALCTGSGASLLGEIQADCFLTGDIKYHDAMLAKALGIAMIDIGHFESEQFFGRILAKELKNFGLQAIISQSINPFSYE